MAENCAEPSSCGRILRSRLSHARIGGYVGAVASDTGWFRERKDMIMGFDDALNKAKDLAGEHSDQVSKGIDGAADQVKEHTPDNVDQHVDTGADAARDKLGLGGDDKKDK